MTQTQLCQPAEEYRLFFSNNPAPMFIYERSGLDIVDVNDAFCHVYGYGRDEALGMRLTDLYPEAEKEAITDYAASIKGLVDVTGWHHVRKDGSLMDILIRSHDILLDGKACRVAVITDITAFKRIQSELTRNTSMLEQIFTTANVGIALMDPRGSFVIANDYAMRLFRIVPQDVHRTQYLDYVLPEDQNEAKRSLAALLERKISLIDVLRRYRCPDGSEFWGHLVAKHCVDKDQHFLGILGVMIDVTKQQQALLALDRERAHLQTLVRSIPDLVWSKDPDGRYQMCNPAFERFRGRHESELIGKTMFDFFPREQAEIFRAQELTIMETGQSLRIEEWFTFADGSRLLLDLVRAPLRDGVGRIVGTMGVARDVTASRFTQIALRERVKEQKCLYVIFALTDDLDMPLDAQLDKIPALLCQGWQWPELATARIEWEGRCHDTPDFSPTPWMISAQSWTEGGDSIHLHVAYTSQPESGRELFLAEERILADTIANRLADVINRRHAARQIKEHAHLVATMFSQTTDSIVLVDPRTQGFVDFNTPAHTDLGYAREEFARLHILDIQAEHSPDEISRNSFAALHDPLEIETQHRCKDGRLRDVHLRLRPVTMGGQDLICAVWRDVTEQKDQERQQKIKSSRLRLQNLLLGALATSTSVQDGDIPRLAHDLTETIGNALRIPRVSVWTMNDAGTQLFCEDLFEVATQTHSRGAILEESACSNEMRVLKSSRYVDASDARTDPRTVGYMESYLAPQGIFSMLDCVVISGGRNRGVVCFEYTEEQHLWQSDEIAFGCQVADQVGMALLNKERLEAAAELRWDARVRQTLERLYLLLLGGEVSLGTISRAVLDEALALLECAHGYVGAFDADKKLELHALAATAEGCGMDGEALRATFQPDARGQYPGLWGHGLNTRTIFRTNTPTAHPASTGLPAGHIRIDSFLSSPVLLGETLVGQIGLANKTGGFTPRDESGLAQIADLYALAVQRVRAHEALVSSTKLREEILRGISAGIFILDPQTRLIEDANDVALAMFRASLDQLRGRPCTILDWHDASGQKITRCDARHHAIFHQDFLLHRPDGSTLPVSKTVISAMIDGKPKFVEILFDISAQKEMERQLALAQKMESIGQLAAGIAHEINTPSQYVNDNLGFVSEGFASLTSLLAEAKEQGRDADCAALWLKYDVDFLLSEIPLALSQSLEGIGRITNIVQAMKRFSHPGGEQREMVNVNEALRNTTLVSRNEWKYDADLVMELDPDLPLISGFGSDLNQVFLNVLVNAAHAVHEKNANSGTKGSVTIATRTVNGSVEISFTDTGCGIAPENLSRVFDPFFTTKPVGKGTGQGLAISYQIVVAKHGGTIVFHSTPGQGTQCVITLPVATKGALHE